MRNGGTFSPFFNSASLNLEAFWYDLPKRIKVGMIPGCLRIHGINTFDIIGNRVRHGINTVASPEILLIILLRKFSFSVDIKRKKLT